MSEAFAENPVFAHVFPAYKFSAVGTWAKTRTQEVPAEATVAVANKAAKNKKIAKDLARTALVDHKFDPAEITFEKKDDRDTKVAVDVYISALR